MAVQDYSSDHHQDEREHRNHNLHGQLSFGLSVPALRGGSTCNTHPGRPIRQASVQFIEAKMDNMKRLENTVT